MTETSDESVLSSQRGNASVNDGLRAMAYRVIAVRSGYPNVGLEYRPLDIVTIWATSGKERASGEVSVVGA